MPRDKRERLKDRLLDRAGLLMEEAKVHWIIRCGAKTFWLSGKLDEVLGLD